ncbi:MAG: M48 family metallopeptidase [Bacteroidetes bacterium]|nr:M48 family metallopeptidase [Bacteroidota bacterium]
MRKIILFILLVSFTTTCKKAPVTGRRQLNLVSNEKLIPMSFQTYEAVLDTSKLSNDKEQVAMVKRVGRRIQKATEEYMAMKGQSDQLAGFEWEFNLIEADIVNAWAMPGGKVAFYTGIMPICKNEKGVAVVMGHEVAHAVAGHGAERMSGAQGIGILGTVGSILVGAGTGSSLSQEAFNQAFGLGAGLTMLKFSRKHESEADHIGLVFMALAGYDPHTAPKFWERMSEMSGGEAPPEFLSTHPSHDTRISDLNVWIPEAMKYFKKRN